MRPPEPDWLFVSLLSAKTTFRLQSKTLRLVLFLILSLSLTSSSFVTGQQSNGRVVVFPVTLQWNKQKDVSRYRLQIAADEKFQDVYFDSPVYGNRHVVKDLPPGTYYWRAAPADFQLGAFSPPVRFFLSGGVVTTVQLFKTPRRIR